MEVERPGFEPPADGFRFQVDGFNFFFKYIPRQHKYTIEAERTTGWNEMGEIITLSQAKGEAVADALESISKAIEKKQKQDRQLQNEKEQSILNKACPGFLEPEKDPFNITKNRVEHTLLDIIRAEGGEMDTERMYSILEDMTYHGEEATGIILEMTDEFMEPVGEDQISGDIPGETIPARFRLTNEIMAEVL